MANFPNSLDSFINPTAGSDLNNPSHSLQHSDINDAVEAIERKLGIGTAEAGSAVVNAVLVAGSAGVTSWQKPTINFIDSQTATSGQVITADGTGSVNWITPAPMESSFRNMIINGSMEIWQRGTSFTANNVFTADRWWFVNDGVGASSVTRQDISSQGLGFNYCLRAERTSGTNRWVIGTNLETETLAKMKGKTVTLSFYARKGSALTSNLSVVLRTTATQARFGAAVDTTTLTVQNSSMNTSTFTRFSTNLSVPANTAALGFNVEFTASQSGAANAYFDITGVQVEVGDVVTPFEFKPIVQELDECKRYYQRLSIWNGFGEGTTFMAAVFQFDKQMRTGPNNITAFTSNTISWRTAVGTDATATGWSSTAPTANAYGMWVLIGNLSGLVDGHPSGTRMINANDLFGVEAEL